MSIYTIKEREVPDTPLLLFECILPGGDTERWCTHQVTVDGQSYSARVLLHNSFDLRAGSEDGIDGASRVSLTLANADSHFSQIERNEGFKGSKLTVKFVFFDLKTGVATTASSVLFKGIANPPEECTESRFRLSFNSRLNLQRVLLPNIRIQRRCPWLFPSTAEQRTEAVNGGENGKYSSFFRCGYSPDQFGGVGNLNSSVPYTSCDYTRANCEQRGMFSKDSSNRLSSRFGGIEFVPASTLVRSAGEAGRHVSNATENLTRYNDFVPMIYGTAWYEPPIVFAKNDGNLTRMEVLLGANQMQGVLRVVVNGIEIPIDQSGQDMTATGWFNVVGNGYKSGGFNLDFADGNGQPLGDPYGSMAYASIVVPNRISDGRSLPKVEVLVQGQKLSIFNEAGDYIDETYSNNPAWVILDVLRRIGWANEELNIGSFARAAAYSAAPIETKDLNGNTVLIPRYECNLVLRRRLSAADLLRGIRTGSPMLLTYGDGGKLELRPEGAIATQQPTLPPGSNSTTPISGGWPSYEFGDGSSIFGGILRRDNSEPSITVFSRSTADTSNRITLEFQDSFNEYQQDSVSLVNPDDVLLVGQEIAAPVNAMGVGNFDQALRVVRLALNRSLDGNLFIEFETSMKGLGIRPGDLISVTYLKEGFERQLFRVVKISPRTNYRTALITAQIHEEEWYTGAVLNHGGRRRRGRAEIGIPRPLTGTVLDEDGNPRFGVTESATTETDGSANVDLTVEFAAPSTSLNGRAAIPLVSFAATILAGSGTLHGAQTLYYAVSASDSDGIESELSFSVRATIPAGPDNYAVRLDALSFDADTVSFSVYRGTSPQKLERIAHGMSRSSNFFDTGLPVQFALPPDPSYDHANFYWRLETLPAVDANIFTSLTIGNSDLTMLENEHRGSVVCILKGKGAGQERQILSNDPTTISILTPWTTIPDSTSEFSVAESAWKFGGVSRTDRVIFTIPNRRNATVQISGRAANARDEECPAELSPITRWLIGGDPGGTLDIDPAAEPGFGIFSAGDGTLELLSVSFLTLANTRTVAGGTLTLHFWDELSSPTFSTTSGITLDDVEFVYLTEPGTATEGSLIQLNSEVMRVEEVLDAGARYRVTRALFQTTAEEHADGMPVYHLSKRVIVVPFVRDFFGSPSSGSFTYRILMPNVRVAAAELFVTNSKGDSPVGGRSYTSNTDRGLRSLSGGQMTIQLEGYLAIRSDAAPPLISSASRAIRDVFAVVREAPNGGDIDLRVLVDGSPYCDLTILDGETVSDPIDGFGRSPIPEMAIVSLDILSVPPSGAGIPGRDLTVTLRH